MKVSSTRCLLLMAVFGNWKLAQAEYVQCPGRNLDPVIHEGKRFFHSVTGDYFPIKGIAYYPRPNDGRLSISNSVDFFTDEYRDLWEADIAYFRQLGVNTIRIYAVDPSRNHDDFMCALQDAGIYVILGLLADCLDCGIGPDEAPSCYPDSLKQRGQFIINEFSKYSNLLLFSAGNEATLYARERQVEINAVCQKKFLRDMRSYVDTCHKIPASALPRRVPIGMANWDNQREAQALYFNCRTDPKDVLENSEWYGINSYQHCSPSVTAISQLSGWNRLREDFASLNLSVPVVISEYGCREPFPTIGQFEAQRTWLQVDALYSPSFVEEFAGGVVFEYSAEKRIADTSSGGHPWPYYQFMKIQYGVGYYSPVDCDHETIPCEYNAYPEFDLLSAKLEIVDNSFVPNVESYVPDGEIPECPAGFPAVAEFDWSVDEQPDLPCYLVPTSPPTVPPTISLNPSNQPTKSPTPVPIIEPSKIPSANPTAVPRSLPSATPPTDDPTTAPSPNPSIQPSSLPTSILSSQPTIVPSVLSSTVPPMPQSKDRMSQPSSSPTSILSSHPSTAPSVIDSAVPSMLPTDDRTAQPSVPPSVKPTSILATIDAPAAFSQPTPPDPQPTKLPTLAPIGSAVSSRESSSAPILASSSMLTLAAFVILLPVI